MGHSGSVSRRNAQGFNLSKMTPNNGAGGRAGMFATSSKQQIFGNGHKTSKSSYENTSVHTAMTTALTASNMSTTMMMR